MYLFMEHLQKPESCERKPICMVCGKEIDGIYYGDVLNLCSENCMKNYFNMK